MNALPDQILGHPHADGGGLTHARARELAELCYTISPEGANTPTVRNGRRVLRDALMRAKRFDEIAKDGKIPKEQKDEVKERN
jgi:hypothetical protein